MKLLLLTAALAALAAPATAQTTAPDMKMPAAAATNLRTASGVAVVKAIEPAAAKVTLAHEPIAALGWPAMTMTLNAKSPGLLSGVKVGDTVEFTLQVGGAAPTLVALAAR